MARRSRRLQSGISARAVLKRLAMVALAPIAIALVLLPQSMTDRARVWAGPVFRPLQNLTEDWTLDIADRIGQGEAPAPSDGPQTQAQVKSLENALAQATALLNQYDRQIHDLTRLRGGLNGLPCRLVPARFLAPEVSGGRMGAMVSGGFATGIGQRGAVIQRRLDRGTREALASGEPVLTAAGLLGIVDEVGPLTSTVRLVTDPRCSLMVQIVMRRGDQWRAGPDGVARGAGDGQTVTVEGVPRTSEVAPGDFVVTSPSPESALPPYLIVGRVVRCDLKPTALFYTLVVEPRVASDEVREVYVLSPDLEPASGP